MCSGAVPFGRDDLLAGAQYLSPWGGGHLTASAVPCHEGMLGASVLASAPVCAAVAVLWHRLAAWVRRVILNVVMRVIVFGTLCVSTLAALLSGKENGELSLGHCPGSLKSLVVTLATAWQPAWVNGRRCRALVLVFEVIVCDL